MRCLFPAFVVTLVVVCTGSAFAQGVGDRVVITKDSRFYTKLQQEHQMVPSVPVAAGTVLTLREAGNQGWFLAGSGTFANGIDGWIDSLYCLPVELALPHFSEIIRRAPQRAEGYNARGNVWFARGDDGMAIGDFSEAIRFQPQNAEYLSNRGRAYTSRGDYGSALVDHNEAIRIDGENAEYFVRRGDNWLMQGVSEKALADFNAALVLDSTNSLAFCHRGIALAQKGEYGAAITSFEDSIRNNSTLSFSYTHLAWTLATCPDARFIDGARAVKNAKAACTLNGWRRWNDFGTLGAAYAAAGEFDRAMDYQNRAIQITPRRNEREEGLQRLELYRKGQPFRTGISAPAAPAPAAQAPGSSSATQSASSRAVSGEVRS